MSKKNEAKNMSDYDYKEEANKLKEKRNFDFSINDSINEIEKEISIFCENNLELYKQTINKTLNDIEEDIEENKEDIYNEFVLSSLYRVYLVYELNNLLYPPHIPCSFETEEEYINSIKCKFEG